MVDQQAKMVKQMMDLQRNTFDGMINNMLMSLDQTDRMLNVFLDQSVWLPEEGKKAFKEWIDGSRKGCETFKSAVDDGYSRLEKCFTGWERPQ